MKTRFISASKHKQRAAFPVAIASLLTLLAIPQLSLAQPDQNSAMLDYDGDGVDDIAFRRASTFETIVYRSSDGQTHQVEFGKRAGDVPVVGDFDGDGITDVAVRRASGQIWYVQNSSGTDRISGNSDGVTRMRFGLRSDDIPVPADYDGDGITDLAVRRPSTQTWYILNSSGVDTLTGNSDGITRRQFGTQSDDIPVPADYDGDGKADLAVRRPGTQFWYILNSSGVDPLTSHTDGISRIRFGTQQADIPVPADYDGDGKADLAVRRPGTQFWYIMNSSGVDGITGHADGITRRQFGLQENDVPVPADYDGDGKVDLAVRRAATSQWFVLNSSGNDTLTNHSDGISRLSFGSLFTDLPLAQPIYSLWNNSDIDEDGLSKLEEETLGTDYTAADSDGDGLTDGDEVNLHNTNATVADSDGDGLSDGDEINIYNTDPGNADSDGDGVNDGDEITAGTDPNVAPVAEEFTQSALIASIVDNIYVPTFELFAQKALTLNTSVSAYCASLPADNNNNRGAAQEQWKTTMDTWQMAELMQVGPLFFNNNELRDEVYSWPNNRACFVDQDVVLAEQAGYNIATRNVSRKGLDALEYLLFDEDLDHKCTTPGTEPAGWNERSDADRTAARCSFASLVSSDVLSTANDIVTQWTGTNGYASVLKDAGNPGSDFSTTLDAINDISDGLFYFTGPVKDGKIAAPVGIRVNNCGLVPCAQDAESPYSDYSLQNIINNMRALRTLLTGSNESDASFVDFLTDVGDQDTATNIIAQLDEAIALAEQMTGTYSDVLTQTPESVEQLHSEVNDVDDILKGDFIQSLSLQLPSTSAGDND
ncbi:imelysin family protein [Planctobacterium marinum]|uniref:imelysin family protein n=1 Tax=Planctobacterium marinum TaxID=1631968 RepID=UPI001E4FBEFB|nr:imelysin family protein [Planctobacterium marinum]MCC2606749.1 FG-GAP-like repeat-containing protein [Planctobacterium marinum]